jgi:type IX secretion system PorP/SprF family membrane protein
MRKTGIAILAAISLQGPLHAQQRPHYTQYVLNQYILNPALSGIENYTDVRLSHRRQWVGIQDAPVTTYLTLQTPIGKKDLRTTSTSFSGPSVNPRGRQYWVDYLAAEPHHGVGLQILNDRAGPLSRFSAMATYAYHIGLSARTNLAAGFGAGIERVALDGSRLVFGTTTIDPALASSAVINRFKPDMSVGLYLYSASFFAGVSVQQFVPENISFANNTIAPVKGRLVPHVFATAGFRFLLGEDFNMVPSVMVKSVSTLPPSVEANLKLQYRDLLWVGGSYRHEDGFAGLLGVNISSSLNIGYAFDYTTSPLNAFTRGTHEVLVGFLIGSRFEEKCPRNVW